MELSESVLEILDFAGLDVTRDDSSKQHNLSNDDGDILQRWRRNRMAKNEEKDEVEEDFLVKYLKKKDQDTQTIPKSFRNFSTVTQTETARRTDAAVQCPHVKCHSASVQTTAGKHRRSVALQFSSAKNHKECQTEPENASESTTISPATQECPAAQIDDATGSSKCPDTPQPTMAELEENFSRIIAEIESAPEMSDEDPILEFLLQRREEIARDVQLIDQALTAVA